MENIKTRFMFDGFMAKAAFEAGYKIEMQVKGSFNTEVWKPIPDKCLWSNSWVYRIKLEEEAVPLRNPPTWFIIYREWGPISTFNAIRYCLPHHPTVRHKTREEADAEAVRLAGLYPGVVFYVMEMKEQYKGIAVSQVNVKKGA